MLVLLAGLIRVSAGTETGWRFSNPQPHGNNIIDMAIHDGVVWEVGDRGSLYTSIDLDNWFPRETGTTQSLRGITFLGNKAFISGSAGTIVSGENPWELSAQSIGTTDWLEGIAASTNMIVAVGDNGAIYHSSDGQKWSRVNQFTTWLRSVAYGLGRFVCAGEGGFLATSADGTNWQQQNLAVSEDLNRVTFTGNMFWIVGDNGVVITNDFRLNFVPFALDVTNSFYAVASNTNEVVLAGDSIVVMRTAPNPDWVLQSDASSAVMAPLWPFYSAVWDGRLFLLGGREGMKVEGYRTNLVDPLLWYSDLQPTRDWLWSVTHQGLIYAAVGDRGSIVTSSDGIDWNREAVPTNALPEVLLGTGGNTNCLLAVGTSGTILYSLNTFTNLVSTNDTGGVVTNLTPLFGVEWLQAATPVTNSLQGVCATDTGFLVTGQAGTILSSINGSAWIKLPSPTEKFLSSVSPGPNGYVAVGDIGTVLTSSDGLSWTTANSGVTNWIYSVSYANSTLVAVGEAGLILTSSDGTTWTRRQSGVSDWLNDAAYVNSTWYVAANSGMVLSSLDTVNWQVSTSATSRTLNSLAFDGSQLIAAGADGMILRKNLVAPLTPVSFLSYSQNLALSSFLFEGQPDQRFMLEEANALNGDWTPIVPLELLDSSGTLLLQTEERPSFSKFFRTRLLE
jgi:hypothetical protein